MAFDGVFVDKSGKPFPKEIGEVLEKCVTDFLISNKDVDPTIVVDSAKKAGERANGGGVIRQLYSYVKTIIDRDSRRASRPALQSARVTSPLTSVEPPGITILARLNTTSSFQSSCQLYRNLIGRFFRCTIIKI
jgi:hypothetical protein